MSMRAHNLTVQLAMVKSGMRVPVHTMGDLTALPHNGRPHGLVCYHGMLLSIQRL